MSALRSSPFAPQRLDEAVLETLFVGQHRLLEQLVDDVIRTTSSGGARFELLVGPAGVGKSHLLALVGHRLARHRDRGDLVQLSLSEDEYPASLVDLLARLLRTAPEEEGAPPATLQLARLQQQPASEQLDAVIALLTHRIGSRPAVFLIEHLDRVFDVLGPAGQSRLRGLLQERRRWSIVASSRTWSQAFESVAAPFYRMFHRLTLLPLGQHAAHEMLVRLAQVHEDQGLIAQLQWPKGLDRVRALRLLVGPSPRALAQLFPFLRGGKLDDVEPALQGFAEALWPSLRDQLSRLAPGQRPYLEQLLRSWTPLSVGELAALTFSTPQTTSGQLRYLAADGLVVASTVGRHRYYELGEPLYRLAAAMVQPERPPVALAHLLQASMAPEASTEPPSHTDASWPTFLREMATHTKREVVERNLSALGEPDEARRLTLARALLEALQPELTRGPLHAGWKAVGDALEALGWLPPRLYAVLEALLALPDGDRFARLAQPERAWVRALLTESELGRGLPAEPQ